MRSSCGALMLLVTLLVAAGGSLGAPASRLLQLEAVVVEPDDRATEVLVRRLLTIRPGDPIDSITLGLVRQDLEGSGYFRDVVLFTSRGGEPGHVVLHVDVQLDRTLHFLTGLGYEPLDGWYLNLIGTQMRNWLRPGSELRFAFRNGYNVDGVYLEGHLPAGSHATDAWLFDLHAGTSYWFAYDDRESWKQGIDTGVFRLGRRLCLRPDVFVTGWLGSLRVEPCAELTVQSDGKEQTRDAADLIDADLELHRYTVGSVEVHWDQRGVWRSWQDGSWAGGRLRIGVDRDGGEFTTFEIEGRHNIAIGPDMAVAGRLRGAHASDSTPYHQRFQFGGVYSVRGYDRAVLSGPLGANNLLQANLEIRAALLDRTAATPKVTGVLFVDTGQAWDVGGASDGWMASAGYGFRLRLPWIHLVGIEVGYPLVSLDDMSPFVVNMALGWSY